LTFTEIAKAYHLSSDALNLLQVVRRNASRETYDNFGRPLEFEYEEERANFSDIQSSVNLPGDKLSAAYKELHEKDVITLSSGWRPDTAVEELLHAISIDFKFREGENPKKYGFAMIKIHREILKRRVAEFKEAQLNDALEAVEGQEVPEDSNSEGWVYLLKVGKFFKIGKTTDLKARMTQLKIQLPQNPDVVYTIKTNDIHWMEKHWHQHFVGKRANGEWFVLKPDNVDAFTSVEQMTVKVSKVVKPDSPNNRKNEPYVQPGLDFC
jgi:hypothetical protein